MGIYNQELYLMAYFCINHSRKLKNLSDISLIGKYRHWHPNYSVIVMIRVTSKKYLAHQLYIHNKITTMLQN